MGLSDSEGLETFFGIVFFGLFIWGLVRLSMQNKSNSRGTSNYRVNTITPVVPMPPQIKIEIEDPNVCPNCSHKVDDGMFFCDKCGTKIR